MSSDGVGGSEQMGELPIDRQSTIVANIWNNIFIVLIQYFRETINTDLQVHKLKIIFSWI